MQLFDNNRMSSDHSAKAELFDLFAEVASALSTGRRAEIIDLLAQGERSVEEIANEISQSTANTSHHLRTLAMAGLVRSRREGTRIIYFLSGPEVEELWSAIQRATEKARPGLFNLAEAYLGQQEEMNLLSRTDLMEKLSAGQVVVIDVRPERESSSGHIKGARSIPIDELESQMATLPEDIPVVAYCRGRYCVFAPEAVRILNSNGYLAYRLEDGFPEWRRAGLPVESGQ